VRPAADSSLFGAGLQDASSVQRHNATELTPVQPMTDFQPLISDVREGLAASLKLAGDWDRLLLSCAASVAGPSVVCSSVWARALAETHLKDHRFRTLVLSRGGVVVGLLPLAAPTPAARFALKRDIGPVYGAYPGRSGLLVQDGNADLVGAILGQLVEKVPGWDVFLFRVVEGSACHAAVLDVAAQRSLRLREISTTESPYFELPEAWEELVATLPKKTRWTIRKGETELRAHGELEYVEHTEPASTQALLDAIYAIERKSWKEDSGTSITARSWEQGFYDALVPHAAAGNLLNGHVLRLSGAPIAYILGIAGPDRVFVDLKESFDASFAKYSPGHVLKRFAISSLIARGVRTYDFMGRCESYKMRWAQQTYRSLTLVLYNRTVRGRLARWRSRLVGAKSAANED